MAAPNDAVGIRKNLAPNPIPGTTSTGVPGTSNIIGTSIISCNQGDIIDFVPVNFAIRILSKAPTANAVSVSIKKIG